MVSLCSCVVFLAVLLFVRPAMANEDQATATTSTTTQTIVIAISAALLGLVLLGLLLAFCYRRRMEERAATQEDAYEAAYPYDRQVKAERPVSPPVVPRPVEGLHQQRPMDVDELAAFLASETWIVPFDNTPNNCPLPEDMPVSMQPEKNRYLNILPNLVTRVELAELDEDPTTTYINANWMQGYDRERAYILAQGPLAETIGDFWRMVWEQDAHVIVMITNLVESGRIKCERYWPEPGTEVTFGLVSVRGKEAGVEEDMTTTIVELRHAHADYTKKITHLWYTSWPDHGVPADTEKVIALVERSRSLRASSVDPSSPVIVHCSAGVGRSGVFTAMDILMAQAECEGVVDPVRVLCKLRKARGGCIQTDSQWGFLLRCLLDHLQQIRAFQNYYAESERLEQQRMQEYAQQQQQQQDHMSAALQRLVSEHLEDTLLTAGNEGGGGGGGGGGGRGFIEFEPEIAPQQQQQQQQQRGGGGGGGFRRKPSASRMNQNNNSVHGPSRGVSARGGSVHMTGFDDARIVDVLAGAARRQSSRRQ